MSTNAKVQPIVIIKRKKKGHAGHHGGAWKVAYADFVTAMMALFIVLWLLSSSEQVQKAVGGYFTDPKGRGRDVGNGLKGTGSENITLKRDDMSKLKDKLALAVKDSPALQTIKEHVIFTVTNEGLRVEMVEGSGSMFFESGNAQPTAPGKDLLGQLASEIGKLPNSVAIEGHTDSQPFAARADYSNWELSTDRANAARRWMEAHGMRDDQVRQVRGYADQSPREKLAADDPSNRRITVIIQYQPVTQADIDAATGKTAAAAGKAEGGKAEAGKAEAGKPEAGKPEATPGKPEPAGGKPPAAAKPAAEVKPSPLKPG